MVRAGAPEVRRPGEDLADITDRLSQSRPAGAPTPRLVDVTAEVGLDSFVSFAGARTSQLPEDMGAGAAWGDFDGDGDEDLFLVAAGGALDLAPAERAPSLLYENQGGRFVPVVGFPEIRILGMAAAWADYDGDGWLDLVVTGYDSLILLRNDGGELRRDPAIPDRPGFWTGASWGDYDNDGDPDLYVCGYVEYRADAEERSRVTDQYGAAVPYTLNPTSFAPARNLLFTNQGDGTFVENAEPMGVADPTGRSLTALWQDWNADGWLDLYVANDISDNALFLNRGEVFEEVGLAALVADYRGAMGLAAGDWNRDGDLDLFITHWVAQENALYDSRLGLQPATTSDPATSRVPTFSDLSAPTGLGQIALPLVGWGTEFADLDGDGWLDLLVANGSTLETRDGSGRLEPQPPLLLWNRAGEHFHDLAAENPSFAEPHVARGLAVADYDADGDLDVLIVQLDRGVRLFRNDMQTGHWLELELRRPPSSPGGVLGHGDATVVAWIGDTPLVRSTTRASYLSQSTRLLHFGLGEATVVDRVEVHWVGGALQSFGALASDARWRLVAGDPQPHRLDTAVGATPARSLTAEQRREFWRLQRQAMDVLKRDLDPAAAIPLFERVLALDPGHEDSRYYLANALAFEGRIGEALRQLDELRTRQPLSHRGHRQWGVLRARSARSRADLEAAEAAVARALELNREETGSLLALGEIHLLLGDLEVAREELEWACRSNPRAVSGFFLRAYLAWSRGDLGESRALLAAALAARGEERLPRGAVAEGDVERRMHREGSPLGEAWQGWNGEIEPLAAVFAPVEEALAERSFPATTAPSG
ncbi:MAG TPA: FG-GAP-like repeat-containing protein [Thermoanaerobaculia bacterium]|nr:FG-GAP-like repeat-containing protein [Thermoanaerobaculia bacterium]